jgi:hypothetical protein
MWNPRRGGTRRAKFSYRRVFSFLFLFRFFEVVPRQTACLVWTGLPPCFFWAALPLSSILELDGPCLVRDIWISIDRKHKFVLFWETSSSIGLEVLSQKLSLDS